MGEEAPPANLLANMVFVAVESRAIRTGDVATLQRLASESQLSIKATAMGQEIRALGEREQLSPVKIMEDIKVAREVAYEKKTGKSAAKATQEEVADMKQHIRKNASKRPSWEEFINEIKCGY